MMDQPYVSVDVVPISFGADVGLRFGTIRRALAPHAGELALPGVLLNSDGERIGEAVSRALESKASVRQDDTLAVRQLGAFDGSERDPRGPTISIAHVAVLKPDIFLDLIWLFPGSASELPFDHDTIVAAAFGHARNLLWSDQDFTAALTGETFSSLTAAALTTAVAGIAPDKGNLNRTLAGDKRLTKLDEKDTTRPGRPSTMWRWNE